jgi:hypothetical protein
MTTNTTATGPYALNYTTATSILNLTAPPAANFTVNITNIPLSREAVYNIALSINTATNKTYCNVLTVNGVTQTIRYAGGVAGITLTSALAVVQTFSIFVSGGAVSRVISSVSPFF